MPYFLRMSVTFFKNGLKWLGYMNIKGYGVELASYQNFKSNMVSGKCTGTFINKTLCQDRSLTSPERSLGKPTMIEVSCLELLFIAHTAPVYIFRLLNFTRNYFQQLTRSSFYAPTEQLSRHFATVALGSHLEAPTVTLAVARWSMYPDPLAPTLRQSTPSQAITPPTLGQWSWPSFNLLAPGRKITISKSVAHTPRPLLGSLEFLQLPTYWLKPLIYSLSVPVGQHFILGSRRVFHGPFTSSRTLHTATNLHFSLNIAMAIPRLNGGEWPTQEMEDGSADDHVLGENLPKHGWWRKLLRDVDSLATIWSPSAAAGDLQTGKLIDG